MLWNNIIKIKTFTKNIGKNCDNVVNYLENRYENNFIKEESNIGDNDGISYYLVRTARKINNSDLEDIKYNLGEDLISISVSADTKFDNL